MKSRFFAGITIVFLLFGMMGASQAALVKIGSGTHWDGAYGVVTSNLLWDNAHKDSSGNSLVWLDFSAPAATWDNQNKWAAGINSMMPVIDPGYVVDWGTNLWRLPDAHNQDGTGPDRGTLVKNSEMGHLFYTDLGNFYSSLTNTGEFKSLGKHWYWSGTEYDTDDAWLFAMYEGSQSYANEGFSFYGLAVRSGHVSAAPVPGAVWLLGSGLAGLVVVHRRKKRNRI